MLSEAKKIRKSIETICRQVIEKETSDCVRIKKCTLVDKTSQGKFTVRLAGEGDTIDVPFSSTVQNAQIDDTLWLLIISNNLSNAIAWEYVDFKAK